MNTEILASIWIEIQQAEAEMRAARESLERATRKKAEAEKTLEDTRAAAEKLARAIPEPLLPFARVTSLNPSGQYMFAEINLPNCSKIIGSGYISDGYNVEWKYATDFGETRTGTSLADAVVGARAEFEKAQANAEPQYDPNDNPF